LTWGQWVFVSRSQNQSGINATGPLSLILINTVSYGIAKLATSVRAEISIFGELADFTQKGLNEGKLWKRR
jgi:hypothetical protein